MQIHILMMRESLLKIGNLTMLTQPLSDQNDLQPIPKPAPKGSKNDYIEKGSYHISSLKPGVANEEHSFLQQIVAFLILEFRVILHSIIGLKLRTAGPEFSTLYLVRVFY